MSRKVFAGLLLLAAGAAAQRRYAGPKPPQPDTPYLLHATTLVPTETSEAKEEPRRGDEIAYVVKGAASSAKTPLASPIFLYQADKIAPERLEIYRVDSSKGGNHEVVFSKRKRDRNPRAFRLSIQRLAEGLYRLEVVESLENGEYCVTPSESNQVFCFSVY